MKGALDKMAAILTDGQCTDGLLLPWGKVRFSHAQAIRAALLEKHAPATARKVLAALRGVLHTAWRLNQIEREDYQRAIDFESVKGSTLPAGRALSAGDIRALFEACRADRNPAKGARDAALLAVLYGGGLRRAELVNLDVRDYDAASGTLHIRRGKGRKARSVPVVNGTKDALDDWLKARPSMEEEHPLFVPVQRFVGHESVTTTARYDRRPDAVTRVAARKMHVPYMRKKD